MVSAPFAASRVCDELAALALDSARGDARVVVSLDRADAVIDGNSFPQICGGTEVVRWPIVTKSARDQESGIGRGAILGILILAALVLAFSVRIFRNVA